MQEKEFHPHLSDIFVQYIYFYLQVYLFHGVTNNYQTLYNILILINFPDIKQCKFNGDEIHRRCICRIVNNYFLASTMKNIISQLTEKSAFCDTRRKHLSKLC